MLRFLRIFLDLILNFINSHFQLLKIFILFLEAQLADIILLLLNFRLLAYALLVLENKILQLINLTFMEFNCLFCMGELDQHIFQSLIIQT